MPVKNRIVTQCRQCGRDVERTLSQIEVSPNPFCSRKCKGDWGKAHPRGRKIVQCTFCGNDIERLPYQIKARSNHFCNKQCNARWLEKQTGSLSPHYSSVTVKCEQCGKEIQKPPGRLKRNKHTFCGRACHYEYKSNVLAGDGGPNWQGGSPKFYGPNWRKQSEAARERDGYRCRVCGETQKEIDKALDVHHITPFKSFQYVPGENDNYIQANRLDNLISLCMRCHALVEIGKLACPVK